MKFMLALCIVLMTTFAPDIFAAKPSLPKSIDVLRALRISTMQERYVLINECKQKLAQLTIEKCIKEQKNAAKQLKNSHSPGRRSPTNGWQGSWQKKIRDFDAEIRACRSAYKPQIQALYDLEDRINEAIDRIDATNHALAMSQALAS